MVERARRAVPLFIVLLGTWLLLQGELSTGNVIGGAVVAAALLMLVPVRERAIAHRLHPWAFAKFIVFVLYSLVNEKGWTVVTFHLPGFSVMSP